jgi:hypothetical protein
MDAAFMSFQRNIGLARGMDAAFMSFQRKVGLALSITRRPLSWLAWIPGAPAFPEHSRDH